MTICSRCKKRPQVKDRKCCHECLANNRQAMKRRADIARQAGLCPACRKNKPSDGSILCGSCQERSRRKATEERDEKIYVFRPRKKFKKNDKDVPANLTGLQLDVILGSLLGDGSLKKKKVERETQNSSFREAHGDRQMLYCKWKHDVLLPFADSFFERAPKETEICGHTSHGGPSYEFTTIAHPIFTELERKWYKRDSDGSYVFDQRGWRIKTIPTDLKLTPRMVAIWYCDDGCNGPKNRNVRLCTDSFSWIECEVLVEKLKGLGIRDSGIWKNNGRPRIAVGAGSYIDFIDMVRQHIPTIDMQYKIDLTAYKEPVTIWQRSKLTDVTVTEILRLLEKDKSVSVSHIADKYDVCTASIYNLIKGKIWKHITGGVNRQNLLRKI